MYNPYRRQRALEDLQRKHGVTNEQAKQLLKKHQDNFELALADSSYGKHYAVKVLQGKRGVTKEQAEQLLKTNRGILELAIADNTEFPTAPPLPEADGYKPKPKEYDAKAKNAVFEWFALDGTDSLGAIEWVRFKRGQICGAYLCGYAAIMNYIIAKHFYKGQDGFQHFKDYIVKTGVYSYVHALIPDDFLYTCDGDALLQHAVVAVCYYIDRGGFKCVPDAVNKCRTGKDDEIANFYNEITPDKFTELKALLSLGKPYALISLEPLGVQEDAVGHYVLAIIASVQKEKRVFIIDNGRTDTGDPRPTEYDLWFESYYAGYESTVYPFVNSMEELQNNPTNAVCNYTALGSNAV